MPLLTSLIASSVIALGPNCGSATPTLAEVAASDGRFQTLVAAVDAAGLMSTLQGSESYTVFAPTDAAFAKLPAGTVESLLKPENKQLLQSVLLYHVVPGNMPAKHVLGSKVIATANGQRLDVSNCCTEGPKIDGAKIVLTDIKASNGTIHVIDSVVLPSQLNIAELASSQGTFQTLLAAAKAANLVDALSAKGPITVFAPTDAAFAKLPDGTIEELLKPENKEKLAAILTYHVVPGRVYSDAAIEAGMATTLQGNNATIRSKSEGVYIDNSKIVMTDLEASNGVIHVIDTVMMPRMKTASAM
ncbi:MAG: fasciclin domain-containing protein [Phycisphaerales bacterium]|nr:fasciclin domain-containing protein [Phycisphaerales bacterium]